METTSPNGKLPTKCLANDFVNNEFDLRCLNICPNGLHNNYIKAVQSHIGLFLKFVSSESNKFSINFALGILGKATVENFTIPHIKRSGEAFAEVRMGHCYGFSAFISHQELFTKYKQLIVDGQITFFCDVSTERIIGACY